MGVESAISATHFHIWSPINSVSLLDIDKCDFCYKTVFLFHIHYCSIFILFIRYTYCSLNVLMF